VPTHRKRVLYVSSHSLPYANNGYAIRTEGIVDGLIRNGLEVVLVTRAGRPWSFGNFDEENIPVLSSSRGFKQIFLQHPNERNMPQTEWVAKAQQEYIEIIQVFKPDAVLAASDWVNALPALGAANKTRKPFFYEIRGFWELSRKSKTLGFEHSGEFAMSRKMEIEIASSAQSVFTLNNLMKADLEQRGIDGDKIRVIPNAVRMIPETHGITISDDMLGKFSGNRVVGYIGAFADYEGLDDLVQAVSQLIHAGERVKLLLVGSSEPSASGQLCSYGIRLRNMANELGIADHVILTGRVQPAELSKYYSAIDLFVIPRKPFEVCEVVSPIKPLEAFAYGKVVLVSDVAPLKSLSEECNISVFRKGNVTDLTDKMRCILGNTDTHFLQEGNRLKQWVIRNRMFENVVYPMAKDLRKAVVTD
jgi:glycosyltransferase involved in cell wall biosynthesis